MLSNHLCALDLGTTKFCLAVLRFDPQDSKPTLDLVSIPASGMRRGMVSDMREAAKGLTQLIDAAEKQLKVDIRKVVVGIAGSHLKGFRNTVQLELKGQVITESHLEELQQLAEQCKVAEDREVLHAVPISFDIDQRLNVSNPLGFSASILKANYFLVDADRLYLKDVVRLCNQTGLEVARLYSEPFASASVTIADEKKDMGVVIADIGGGTTDGVVFQHGSPVSAFSLNIGGKLLSSDLSVAFNLPPAEAERLKIFFGLDRNAEKHLTVSNVKGEFKTLKGKDVYPILSARIFELCGMLAQELKPFKGSLGGGIILTGGGSEVNEIDQFMQEVFKIPAVKSNPCISFSQINSFQVANKKIENVLMYPTKFATVMGLINLELIRSQAFQGLTEKGIWPSKYINQLFKWFKEMS